MAELLFGVETEYAITGLSASGAIPREQIVQRLMGLAFGELVHLPDLHSSGGMFLENGSRFYVDCGLHPELGTCECMNPWDAVRYVLAGHRIVGGLAAKLEAQSAPGTEILCLRSNVDYGGTQSTWGCHESYLHRSYPDAMQAQIVPHLVSRPIYTGAGGFNPLSKGLEFTLSPRMAHFRLVVTESSTSERGIWHAKSESLCSGYSRLHMLCGESLCSEIATFLKMGATALVVAMADAGVAPGDSVKLMDPLASLHEVAADVTCKRELRMADGSSRSALAIQRRYLELAEAHLDAAFMPPWAGDVCRKWRAVLDQLEDAPGAAAKTLDWGIKLALYSNYARTLGIDWDGLGFWNRTIDTMSEALETRKGSGKAMTLEQALGTRRTMPAEVAELEPLLRARGFQWDDLRALLKRRQQFFEIDTRFGQLGAKGIFETLDASGALDHHMSGVDNIEHAMKEPPASGRAHLRGKAIQRLAGTDRAQCDWQSIVDHKPEGGQALDLSDPFAGEEVWRPLSRMEARSGRLPQELVEIFDLAPEARSGGERSAYSLRQDALELYLHGDFAGAEALLHECLDRDFEVPSTHCHLARVLMTMDREEEARAHVVQAWTLRTAGPEYVTLRILYFQCMFAMFEGTVFDGLLGEIRAGLDGPYPHMDWTVGPMLDHLRARLGETNYTFLKALAKALSGREGMRQLNGFSQWRDTEMVNQRAS